MNLKSVALIAVLMSVGAGNVLAASDPCRRYENKITSVQKRADRAFEAIGKVVAKEQDAILKENDRHEKKEGRIREKEVNRSTSCKQRVSRKVARCTGGILGGNLSKCIDAGAQYAACEYSANERANMEYSVEQSKHNSKLDSIDRSYAAKYAAAVAKFNRMADNVEEAKRALDECRARPTPTPKPR